MKEFIAENYSWLLSLLFSVLGVLLISVKKITLKNTPLQKTLGLLPNLIIMAEKSGKDGKTKKAYVLGVALSYLADLLGQDIKEVSEQFGDEIDSSIEKILQTPQRKE